MLELAYGSDVLQRTIQHMTEFDPSWKVPVGFFPAMDETHTNGSGNGTQ